MYVYYPLETKFGNNILLLLFFITFFVLEKKNNFVKCIFSVLSAHANVMK